MESDVIEGIEAAQMPQWLPCVFGTGDDDDTPGLIAVFANEAVQVGDRVFAPGEDTVISGMHLVFTKGLDIREPDGGRCQFFTNHGMKTVVITQPRNVRNVTIDGCCLSPRP